MPVASKKIDILNKKSIVLIKKTRRQTRKLRRSAIKQKQSIILAWAEKQIEALDAILAEQKAARAARKEAESKK